MRFFIQATMLLAATQLFGCASVSNGTTGTVRLETVSKTGTPIEGAQCSLTNDTGSVSLTTPGSVVVHRSSSDLKIDCRKADQPAGSAVAISRVTGSMFGNILLGGGIGAIVDHSNGSAYNYPEWMKIVLGDNLVFDRKDFVTGAPTQAKAPEPSKVATNASSPKAAGAATEATSTSAK
ncbi:hypothetical protein BH11PSE10_BH11PSE10_12920 [soil metagenome]